MDNRDQLTTVAVAVIGLIVLATVLAAGYLLVSALTGTPGSTPTAAPGSSPTPGPYSSIPSGPLAGTPSNSTYPFVPTPVQPVVKSAELAGWGTDKDTYNRGDTAITYIIIKNTGTVTVNEARLDVEVERYVSVIGYVSVQSTTTTLTDLDVRPGETKKAQYNVTIPSDYQGIPTAGKYRFTVKVTVWDKEIGDFQKEVEVK
jgi:hypothetical protein